ncbi:General negative regulator of transcription subunit 2 [Intoshia linei]|uniref:General negative regulator of transcription subunit 2 n=1 Tax=Intoshia linei TaxID=1819745 RepID=A0A177B745_9BILA|nr:General negative regulator of transcription subunit 2 [Intoshia linei]
MNSGFKMHQDDFPALKDYNAHIEKTRQNASHKDKSNNLEDGILNNIPASLQSDQYGLAAMFMLWNLSDEMSSKSRLFNDENFYKEKTKNPINSALFCQTNIPAQELDYRVPLDYMTNLLAEGKVVPPSYKYMKEDTLFFIFYAFPLQTVQIVAARQLFSNGWRFHKEERCWIKRRDSDQAVSQNNAEGTYIIFNFNQWKEMEYKMILNLNHLEDKIMEFSDCSEPDK